jgi:hypothetical protein
MRPPAGLLGHGRHDDGGVDAAGQEGAQRTFADHPDPGRLEEEFAEPLGRLVLIGHRLRREVEAPVTANLVGPALPDEEVARRQFLDIPVDGPGGRDVLVGQVMVQRDGIHLAFHGGVPHQRLQLRAERQRGAVRPPVQGLFAHTVTAEQQALPLHVPDGEREHPPEPVDEVVAELLIEVHQAFGVALGGEAMPTPAQHVPQSGEVVQLAVEHGGHGPVLVVDRLIPAGHVDDRQSAHAEGRVFVIVEAITVRTSMDHHIAHLADEPDVGGVRRHDPCYSAHRRSNSSR